jgi:hypothetical protein
VQKAHAPAALTPGGAFLGLMTGRLINLASHSRFRGVHCHQPFTDQTTENSLL